MSEEARRIWQEKLNFLLAEEAKCSDPVQKFQIQLAITEARVKLEELISFGRLAAASRAGRGEPGFVGADHRIPDPRWQRSEPRSAPS